MNIRVLCLLALAVPAFARAEVPLSAFSQFNDFYNVKISPTGTYLAAEVVTKDGVALAMVPIAEPKKLLKILPMYGSSIADYSWTGPKQVVVSLAEQSGSLEAPFSTGELMSANADNGEMRYLFGYRGEPETGTHTQHVTLTRASAKVIGAPLQGDPEHVVVSVEDWNTTADTATVIAYKLNLNSGLLTDPLPAPMPGGVEFLADWAGVVRYASQDDIHNKLQVFQRNPEPGSWQRLNPNQVRNALVYPQSMSEDASKAFLISNEGHDRLCAVEQDLATGERRELNCDDTANVDRLVMSFDRKEPVAALYLSDKPRLQLIDTANPDRAKLAALQKAFPNQLAEPVSATLDGSKAVVLVYSDRNVGDYYLFDTKTMRASYLFPVREAINPDEMAERRPVSFKARDGWMIHGYLTLPPGKEAKNLPLVVNPHGGPFWIADNWRWDPDAEMLASRGYAVLQVNFRGSAGYGSAFERAGYKAWDTGMINDITDGARWSIDQGITDPKRVCIYGASFGGYAALMSAEREPDLYRCVVAYAGVYDLVSWKSDADFSESMHGRNYVDDYVAATPEALRKASPLNYVDKLQAAIMIVHGEEDERSPFNQAKALRKALDARHYPYEWMVKSGERHGFYKPENRLELYTRMLAFLDKNIGPGAAPGPAAVAATTAPAAATQPPAAAPSSPVEPNKAQGQ